MGGDGHTSVGQVGVGTPVLFGNSAGCVCLASPAVGSGRIIWPLWLQKKRGVGLHLLVVYIHLPVLESKVLFQAKGLMMSVWELRGLAGMRCSDDMTAYGREQRNQRADNLQA